MIVIVFGLPGSGKSYFAVRLAGLLHAEYIKSDSLRTMVTGKHYSQQDKMLVYDAMLERMKALAKKRDVVIDATFYRQSLRERFKEVVQKNGSMHFIEVIADEPLIKERLKTARSDSDADFEVYKKIKDEWEPLKDEHLIIQSTNDNIGEMLNKAKAYLHLNNDQKRNK